MGQACRKMACRGARIPICRQACKKAHIPVCTLACKRACTKVCTPHDERDCTRSVCNPLGGERNLVGIPHASNHEEACMAPVAHRHRMAPLRAHGSIPAWRAWVRRGGSLVLVCTQVALLHDKVFVRTMAPHDGSVRDAADSRLDDDSRAVVCIPPPDRKVPAAVKSSHT